MNKTCKTCGVEKPVTEFHKVKSASGARPSRGGMGVASRCKCCMAELRKPGINAEREALRIRAERGLKICCACKQEKPFSEFHTSKAERDGHCFKCISCANDASDAWRMENPDANAEWCAKNKKYNSDRFKIWRENNKEYVAERIAKWARENPQKVNALIAKRTAAKLQATPVWADQSAIERIYAEAARITKETGVRHEVDHIVPLQSDIVCGLHWEGNLQVLTKAENISKLNRYWPDMP